MSDATHTAGRITCHVCGAQASLARSVRLRQYESSIEWERFKARFPAEDMSEWTREQHEQFARANEQRSRNLTHNRAFICEPCYKRLDNRYGVAEITTPEGDRAFELGGECRRGRAAVVNYAKWLRYQRRLARKIGIDFEG